MERDRPVSGSLIGWATAVVYRFEVISACLALVGVMKGNADSKIIALAAIHALTNAYGESVVALREGARQKLLCQLWWVAIIVVFYGLFLATSIHFTRTSAGQVSIDVAQIKSWILYTLAVGLGILLVRASAFLLGGTLDRFFRKDGTPDVRSPDWRIVPLVTVLMLLLCCLFPPRKWADNVERNFDPPRGFLFRGAEEIKVSVSAHLESFRTAKIDKLALAKEAACVLTGGVVLSLAAIAARRRHLPQHRHER